MKLLYLEVQFFTRSIQRQATIPKGDLEANGASRGDKARGQVSSLLEQCRHFSAVLAVKHRICSVQQAESGRWGVSLHSTLGSEGSRVNYLPHSQGFIDVFSPAQLGKQRRTWKESTEVEAT